MKKLFYLSILIIIGAALILDLSNLLVTGIAILLAGIVFFVVSIESWYESLKK
jgi:hypothetical protein